MRWPVILLAVSVVLATGCSTSHDLGESAPTASARSVAPAAVATTPASDAPPATAPLTVPPATMPTATVPPTVAITAPSVPDPTFTPLPTNGAVIASNPNNWLGVEPQYLVASGPVSDCQTFFRVISPDPYGVSQCGPWTGGPIGFAWTVTKNTLADGIHALLWRETAPSSWEPVFKYVSEPGVLEAITIQTINLDATPSDELVVQFHYTGTQQLLDIDVVDLSTGIMQVVTHLPGLTMGRAFPRVGDGIELWTATTDPVTGACCVSPFQQSFLRPGWTLTYGELAVAPPTG